MNFLSELLSDTFIYSFGWTLLYSLWHGAIVSFITVILLYFLKNQNSKVRYQVTVFSLSTIVLLSLFTFISLFNYYDTLFSAVGTAQFDSVSSSDNNSFGLFLLDLLPKNLTHNLSYFTTHIPLIFTLWFFTVTFLSIKYLGGFVHSQRLKHNRVKFVDGYWLDKVKHFSHIINLKKHVGILESALIKVPMVIGYFKPIILVPAGFFSGIPSEQIEAILIHELAHIKRNDYLVKLLQTIVEILFFFNPFVWWISAIINKEREHCCDDLAISITKDNISFVKALAGLCELEYKGNELALTFGKSENQIIKRMERIMKRNENKNNFSQFTIAAAVLIVSLIVIGASSLQASDVQMDNIAVEDTNKVAKKGMVPPPPPPPEKKLNKDVPPPPPPKYTKADLMKLEKTMTKVIKAYKEETDPDKKKKYEHKLNTLKKKAQLVKKELSAKKTSKSDKTKLIKKLEYEIKKTTDEEKKAKLKKKLKHVKGLD